MPGRKSSGDKHARDEDAPHGNELRRFADLARKLVQVPKKEVQEAETKRKKRRR